jgi:hypothetical protein
MATSTMRLPTATLDDVAGRLVVAGAWAADADAKHGIVRLPVVRLNIR